MQAQINKRPDRLLSRVPDLDKRVEAPFLRRYRKSRRSAFLRRERSVTRSVRRLCAWMRRRSCTTTRLLETPAFPVLPLKQALWEKVTAAPLAAAVLGRSFDRSEGRRARRNAGGWHPHIRFYVLSRIRIEIYRRRHALKACGVRRYRTRYGDRSGNASSATAPAPRGRRGAGAFIVAARPTTSTTWSPRRCRRPAAPRRWTRRGAVAENSLRAGDDINGDQHQKARGGEFARRDQSRARAPQPGAGLDKANGAGRVLKTRSELPRAQFPARHHVPESRTGGEDAASRAEAAHAAGVTNIPGAYKLHYVLKSGLGDAKVHARRDALFRVPPQMRELSGCRKSARHSACDRRRRSDEGRSRGGALVSQGGRPGIRQGAENLGDMYFFGRGVEKRIICRRSPGTRLQIRASPTRRPTCSRS